MDLRIMNTEEEFIMNKSTVYLASFIMNEFYFFGSENRFWYGRLIDNGNQKVTYQLDLNRFRGQGSVYGGLFMNWDEIQSGPYDFSRLNEPLLIDILKKSINVSKVVIENGILSLS